MAMTDWSPSQYLKFADERARPAVDLLARVPLTRPRLVCDLGCGPANSTAMLRKAFPSARMIGIDNSHSMIRAAKEALADVQFETADLQVWRAPADADLLFSNAAFQWVPRHADHLLRLLKALKPGAVLAVQMPDNLDEPSHALMREVAHSDAFIAKLHSAEAQRERILTPSEYYRLLRPHCANLDIWRTAYQHPLHGAAGIAEFLSSTGLKPYLVPLTPTEQLAFRAQYEDRLAATYSADEQGTVILGFPRLFIVATR
jgi:trans-aconitate 2-methyltransferase